VGIELERGGPIHRIRDELTAALPNAQLVDGSSIVSRAKVIKSTRELELMRKAGRITAHGINTSLRAVTAGITDNDVARVGYDALVGAGSEFMAVNPIVNSGYRSSWHHASFKRVTLRPGDTVFLEYGGAYHRYHAPLMRTAVIDQPSDEVKRIAEAVQETLGLVLGGAKAGRTAHEVARDAHRGYARLEDDIWFMGWCGYSVGIGFPPTWADAPMFIAEGVDRPLLAGMTFHVPIMFRVPGKFAVGLSETIAITETGCEILTESSRALHVAEKSIRGSRA
jgi:Xaa-Pro aminopeptidase